MLESLWRFLSRRPAGRGPQDSERCRPRLEALEDRTAPASLGTLTGTVWVDRNGDGVRQKGEPGQAGVRVYLDANANGRLDFGERFTTTGKGGTYVFRGLPPGTYQVAQDG